MNNELASRILYCDAHCVVVNKIAGEAAEGAGAGMIDLPRLLGAELSAPDYPPPRGEDALSLPSAVHRLDVPVSGCTVFARSAAALRFLSEAFKNNAVTKHYWAIVEASEKIAASAELIHWIQFDSRKNKSIAHNEPGRGRKKAILRYHVAGRGRHYLFLAIELVTGRHHQIRAQLERLGLHVKGDLKYGAQRSESGGGIRLHARSISFPDPAGGGEHITVQADPPLRDNLWQAFEENENNKLVEN